MILGYNKKRPEEKNYIDFENKFVAGIKGLDIEGLSLLIYGSYVRGDYIPGRSDIDAVLVFPDNVIINKTNLNKVAHVLESALVDNNVPFQVTVTDLTTMIDGRFNSYDRSFKPYFHKEAKIVGPDYRKNFRFELPTFDEQVPVRFNLRKARIGLLFSEYDSKHDYEAFLSKFTKSLDSVSRASKQIVYFSDGKLRGYRFSALDAVKKTYPEVDIEPLKKIKFLYTNLSELDELYKRPCDMKELWAESLTCMESMLKAYVDRNPR